MSLARVVTIVVSYLAASIAAGCVLVVTMSFEMRLPLFVPLTVDGLSRARALVFVAAELTATAGLLPALPAIIYSERRGFRSFWTHTYGGGLIGLLAYLLYIAVVTLPEWHEALHVLARSMKFPGLRDCLVIFFPGFAGGLVYWLMAGRTTGLAKAAANPGLERHD